MGSDHNHGVVSAHAAVVGVVRDRARWPAGWRMLNLLTLRPMPYLAKQPPEPPKPISWNIYKVDQKAILLGTVDSPNKRAAIEKAAEEFKADAWRMYAVPRR
jgi:hypothetical protein